MQWIFLMNLYYQKIQSAFIRLYIYFNNFLRTNSFMKHLFILFSVACLGITACTKSSTSNSGVHSTTSIINAVNAGTWKITYFMDKTEDKTANFSGYNFTFGASNALTATNGTNNYSGTWSVTDSNSDDDSIDDLDFNISFTAPDTFTDLTDDWEIMEHTTTKIKLKDVSGGSGETHYLTFEKN